MGLLTERINNKLEKGSLINEHARNHEPVPLRRILTTDRWRNQNNAWGMQQVKNSGKVNLFAGQTIGKIFVNSINTASKYSYFRRGVKA